MNTGQRTRRDHVRQHLHGVVPHNAQITKRALIDLFKQAAHARCMYFYTQVVNLGMRGRDGRRGFTHAETDLQNFRRGARENCV